MARLTGILRGDDLIVHNAKRRSYVLTEKGQALGLSALTHDEAIVLALAHAVLVALPGNAQEALGGVLQKLAAGSAPRSRMHELLQEVGTVIFTPPSPPTDNNNVVGLALLTDAAVRGVSVEIDYLSNSTKERSWRVVDPYGLELYQGRRWHLHGWCHKHQAIRTFSLEAIQAFRLLPSAFERNEAAWEAFRGQEGVVGGLRMGSPIPVSVRFSEEVATLALRSRWPTGLVVQEEPDGSVLLSGTALGTEGILVELLRWRRHAQVLGGEELLVDFRDELREMTALY
jgi:predicted DNA-binding transcriptional regulator YafY